MSDYWKMRLVTHLECSDCSGALKNEGAAPIAGGFKANYKCIRCGAVGSVKDRRGNRSFFGSVREST